MELAQSNPKLTLEDVHDHFQEWRSTRKSKRERIPDDLLAEARSLMERYPQTTILHKLGLSRKRFIAAEPLPSTSTTAKSEDAIDSASFVQIPWPSPETTTPCLELAHPNGMTLRLQDCNEALVAQMVNTFMDHSPCSK